MGKAFAKRHVAPCSFYSILLIVLQYFRFDISEGKSLRKGFQLTVFHVTKSLSKSINNFETGIMYHYLLLVVHRSSLTKGISTPNGFAPEPWLNCRFSALCKISNLRNCKSFTSVQFARSFRALNIIRYVIKRFTVLLGQPFDNLDRMLLTWT